MSAEIHSETDLYRVESRPTSKLVWIETADAVAARLWRVFEYETSREMTGSFARAGTLGSTRAPRVLFGALAENFFQKCCFQCETTSAIGEGANRCTRK